MKAARGSIAKRVAVSMGHGAWHVLAYRKEKKVGFPLSVAALFSVSQPCIRSTKGCAGNQLCTFQGCQNKAADGGVCAGHSSYHDVFFNDDTTDDTTGEAIHACGHNNSMKRPHALEDADDNIKKKRRKRQKLIDLTDVPAQPPILKSNEKGASSKYQGVYFNKSTNKWRARIMIDGKQHHIGAYDNEEDADVDYARAVFKYAHALVDVDGTEEKKRRKRTQKLIDLTDVPAQPPIISNENGASSKYQGVYFNKARNKWKAQIAIDGKRHYIGLYANEEQAAVDYARVVFKYKADKIHDSKEAGGEGGNQHCRFKSCLYKTVCGEICDGHSNHDDVSLRVKLNDDAIDDGKAADACGHNNASRKHSLLSGDADEGGTEKKKRRKRGQQKFIIDLTDVPAKHPYSIRLGWF
eukprot:scaffold217_cov79-Skeletonema_dohrnii-CCMP3373.AAC.2